MIMKFDFLSQKQNSFVPSTFEQLREKTEFLPMQKQRHRSAAFVFATQIVQFLYFLNTKFQASNRLL